MLQVDSLSVAYGGLHALTDVSLTRRRGPVRRHRRTERRRQDDAVQGDLRHGDAAVRAHPVRGPAICWPCRRPQRAAPRHRARAGGPPGVRELTRAREPGDGRIPAGGPRGVAAATSSASSRCSRSSPSAASSSPARCRAASSRCWRSAAAWPRRRSCCCWTSRRWDWRRAVADQIFERIEEIHREDELTILLVEQRVVEALESCDRLRAGDRARRAAGPNADAARRRRGAEGVSWDVRARQWRTTITREGGRRMKARRSEALDRQAIAGARARARSPATGAGAEPRRSRSR